MIILYNFILVVVGISIASRHFTPSVIGVGRHCGVVNSIAIISLENKTVIVVVAP